MKEMQATTKTTLPYKKVAVIWARVSSKSQIEGLINQIEACEEYAANNDIEVAHYVYVIGNDVKIFEEQYKYLFELISKLPEINTVLIDGYDRLARAGATGIMIRALLKSNGVNVLDITQTVVETTQVEELMENILYLYTEFENKICRRKLNAFK